MERKIKYKNHLNPKFLNPLVLVLLGSVFLRMSWQKWVNVTVDYGRELYIPWRITCGQVLYKDVASLFGPFPPYWNALLFKIFGASIKTLVLFNILLVAGITLLIYRFFSYTMDRRIALFTSATFLSLFAFAQSHLFWDLGNFAFICPYSYSVTYALFFSLCTIDLFSSYNRLGKSVLLAATGASIGLTALCRFEIFIFLVIAVVLGFIFKVIIEHWPLQRYLKAGALLLGGFCAPVGIAYLYFSTQLPLSQTWSSILGFNDKWHEIVRSNYYQFNYGLEHPWHNFVIMLATAACYGLAVIAIKCLCAGADRLEKSRQQLTGIVFILLGLCGIAQVTIWILCFPYDDIFRGIPVMIILLVGYLSWLLWGHRRDGQQFKRILPLWVMAVWGLLMITKVFFRVQINSAGFVYAMPGVLLFIILFEGFVPQYFERKYPKSNFVQPLVSVLVVLIFIVGLRSTARVYQSRHFQIQAGSDTIISDASSGPSAREISAFLKDVNKIMNKDANFVVFPEGVILNFWTKKIDPLPYITFRPAELVKFGEQKMLCSFKKHKPDYVILSNQWLPTQYHSIKIQYPYVIRAWILANYHLVWPVHPEINNVITVYKRSE